MSAFIDQLVTAYEVNGLTPEQIVESIGEGLDVAAVKVALQQNSSKYRKACKIAEDDDEELNFSRQELLDVNKVIYEAAMTASYPDGSVDFKTRFNAAKYIRDDKKGRLEPAKALKNGNGNTFNFLQQFNMSLQQAKEKAAKAIES